jgi:signal transduction histidine kinase
MTKRAVTNPLVAARFVVVALGALVTILNGESRAAATLVVAFTATYLIVRLLQAPGVHALLADVILSAIVLALPTTAFSPAFFAVPLVSLWALARRSTRWAVPAGLTYIAIIWVQTYLLWSGVGVRYVAMATLFAVAIMASSRRLTRSHAGPDAFAYSLLNQVRDLSATLEQDPSLVGRQMLQVIRPYTSAERLMIHGTQGDVIATLGMSPMDEDWDVNQSEGELPVILDGKVIATVYADRPIESNSLVTDLLAEQAWVLGTSLAYADIRSMASDAERSRLAREMHDGIAQDVASLGYAIDDLISDAPEEMRVRLRELRAHLTRVVSDLRLSIFELRGRDNGLGLSAALSTLVERVQQSVPFEIHLRMDESSARFPRGVEDELLRIAQEALTNAKRHSQAKNVWVTAHLRPPIADLTIEDDGVGLTRGREDSFGIDVMRERATVINGSFTIRDRFGGGTVVAVRVDPLEVSPNTSSG